jgi:hypothetical protein
MSLPTANDSQLQFNEKPEKKQGKSAENSRKWGALRAWFRLPASGFRLWKTTRLPGLSGQADTRRGSCGQ